MSGIDHEFSSSCVVYMRMPTEMFTESVHWKCLYVNFFFFLSCLFLVKFNSFSFFASLQDSESWVDQSKGPSACAVVSHAVFHLDVACLYLFLHWYTTPHLQGTVEFPIPHPKCSHRKKKKHTKLFTCWLTALYPNCSLYIFTVYG